VNLSYQVPGLSLALLPIHVMPESFGKLPDISLELFLTKVPWNFAVSFKLVVSSLVLNWKCKLIKYLTYHLLY